jgi:hypothetical protein
MALGVFSVQGGASATCLTPILILQTDHYQPIHSKGHGTPEKGQRPIRTTEYVWSWLLQFYRAFPHSTSSAELTSPRSTAAALISFPLHPRESVR